MNIIVTWPKSKPLKDYLSELHRAYVCAETAFFKVPTEPKQLGRGDKAFRVYDGRVRGYLIVHHVQQWGGRAPVDNVTGEQFKPGWYVACSPLWHPIEDGEEIAGFRGYRYVT